MAYTVEKSSTIARRSGFSMSSAAGSTFAPRFGPESTIDTS